MSGLLYRARCQGGPGTRPCLFAFLVCGLLLLASSSAPAAMLENPSPGAIKSGVGVVSGWVCEAKDVTVSFDDGPQIFIPSGSDREDTRGVCGDADNGFGLLINYSNLGNGPHTATLSADGRIQTKVSFSVQTLGTTFLRGVTGQGTVTLSDGKEVAVQWEETTQGFTITGYREADDPEPTDSGVGQFIGTWEFTNSAITKTYSFLDVEPCWTNGALSCVHDYAAIAQLGPDSVSGFETHYVYALSQQDADVCRAFFLHEVDEDGQTVQGDYGEAVGSCFDQAVVIEISRQIYGHVYPTTGRREVIGTASNPPTSTVCSTIRDLAVVDYYGESGRWDITNPCAPWQGRRHVLHIDVVPLGHRFEVAGEEMVITQGTRQVIFDNMPAYWVNWLDRQTLREIDQQYLYARSTKEPYQTALIIDPDAGLDLRQPFTLYYGGRLVAVFE